MDDFAVFRYRVVDVFTQHALEGNALAVFPNASGIDDDRMQGIARELNLAETAFVLPPTRSDCAARVRIFTPRTELPFAGHPTLGTSFVLLDEGLISPRNGQFVLEENIGPVPVRVEGDGRPMLWLTTPPITLGRCYDRATCASQLGLSAADLLEIEPQLLSAGNPTIYVAVRDQRAVDRAWIDLGGMQQLRGADPKLFCVFVFTPTPAGAYARMFAPEYGVVEDPATGSSTGPLAAFMMRHGLIANASGTRFVSEQGAAMKRRSFLHVHIHGENGAESIEVGGYVTAVATASMRLPL